MDEIFRKLNRSRQKSHFLASVRNVKVVIMQWCKNDQRFFMLLFFNLELCRELNFVGSFSDKAFNKSIIRNVTVQDEELCQWKCFLDDICKSYNLGPPQVGEEGKRVCELSSSHHVLHPEYLVSRPGFIHRSSVVR